MNKDSNIDVIESIRDKIIKVYSCIQISTTSPNFKFIPGGVNIRAINKLIKELIAKYGNVSDERIVDICVYISHRYRQKQRKTISSAFSVKHIALLENSKTGLRYYENLWLAEYKLSRKDLEYLIKDRSVHPLAKYIYVPSEEPTKQRMLNEEIGYAVCQTSTLGWAPLSPACQKCKFSQKCMNETDKNYPELFRIRQQLNNG